MDFVINDLNGEEIIERFYKKELKKTNQNEFRIEKERRRKDYDDYFSSWIDKKDLI